jgi:predicted HTH transcriptional regulator
MRNDELGMMNEAVAGLRQPCFIILYFNRLQSSVLCSRTENTFNKTSNPLLIRKMKWGEKYQIVGRKTKEVGRKSLSCFVRTPKLTTAGLTQAVGISPKGVEKQLANLKREGLLRRIGPDKGGHWEVVDL